MNAPLHCGSGRDWQRHHPMATSIALEILHERDLLRLRSARLVRDVMDVFGVGACTARIAVAMARKNAAK